MKKILLNQIRNEMPQEMQYGVERNPMRFVAAAGRSLVEAGRIHSESWKESHRAFCADAFAEKHTPAAQTEYLRREIAAGKRLFLLIGETPVGIVSVKGRLIENLYVLPEEQCKGYGTRLLRFAVGQCEGVPTLWILNNNARAHRFYTRRGFRETGRKKQLNETLFELELSYEAGRNGIRGTDHCARNWVGVMPVSL